MIEYSISKKNDNNIIVELLKRIDNDFGENLSKNVDIEKYIDKINTYGIIIEAHKDDKLIGILGGYVNNTVNKIAYVSIFGVDNEYRNYGIGTELMNHFIKEAQKEKMSVLELETHKENYRAISFYTKYGLEIDNYRKANSNNHIVLRKKI